MQSYDVYFGYISFTDDEGGKERPVVFLEIIEANKEYCDVFAVFSHKKWFEDNVDRLKELYEIVDLAEAGLNKRSYVDFSEYIAVKTSELSKFKRLGRLSDRDILALNIRIEEYNKHLSDDE